MKEQDNGLLASATGIELCHTVGGQFCSKLLGDLGMEVLKIEQPEGDALRKTGPFPADGPHPEKSGLFLYLNTNKKSVTINLETADGRELFRSLLAKADILIEDQPTGALSTLGLDYEQLKPICRNIVMTSITPFGQTGPYADYKAYPLTGYHGGGQGNLLRNEHLERPPVRAGAYVNEYEAGIGAAVVTLAAHYRQRMQGHGEHIDFSKFQWNASLNRANICRFFNANLHETRHTYKLPWGGVIKCKDGYVILLANEDHHWRALTEMMDKPSWALDKRFDKAFDRAKNGVELTGLVAGWFGGRAKVELHALALQHGVPLGIVRTPADLVEAPQLVYRRFFTSITHPDAGAVTYPTYPYRFSETPARPFAPAPRLGQHTADILTHRLSLSGPQLAQLRKLGVI